MESINDGDVVIVDHDLENEETQITDTPGKYLVFIIHSIQSSFVSKSWHISKGIIKNKYGTRNCT
jgi:hypothetical protein